MCVVEGHPLEDATLELTRMGLCGLGSLHVGQAC